MGLCGSSGSFWKANNCLKGKEATFLQWYFLIDGILSDMPPLPTSQCRGEFSTERYIEQEGKTHAKMAAFSGFSFHTIASSSYLRSAVRKMAIHFLEPLGKRRRCQSRR